MRKFIIGLSLVFFSLAGFITYLALEIPVMHERYQIGLKEAKPEKGAEESAPEAEEVIEQPEKINREIQTSVEDVQAADPLPEDVREDNNKEFTENIEIVEPEKEIKVLAVLGKGIFRTGQFIIEENLMSAVDEMVPDILSSPGYRVSIEGHTSNIQAKTAAGKRPIFNKELSLFRAKAVASALEKKGISRERISVTGFGDTRPIASNETYEGRTLNRRVEVKLIPEEWKP